MSMTFSRANHLRSSSTSYPSAFLAVPKLDAAEKGNNAILNFEKSKENIKKLFHKIELSVSPYDTVWVAMVPSPNSLKDPFFPQCVKWVMDNQLHDGSWGAGELQIDRGLHFIESNLASTTNEKQQTPIGFDIIFPTMLEYAQDLNINLSPGGTLSFYAMIRKRELELQRLHGQLRGVESLLGIYFRRNGEISEWERAIKYQRKNGSLFNSPSTTAAAYTHLKDVDCLKYLHSVLDKFGNSANSFYFCVYLA